MLLIGFDNRQAQELSKKYSNKFVCIDLDIKKLNDDKYVVDLIQRIKVNILKYEIAFIVYNELIITLLNKLDINYAIIRHEDDILDNLREKTTSYIIEENSYEKTLSKYYNWIENVDLVAVPENKNKLTFEQLLDENVSITEADVRSLKETQNKLKVGMLLQAKNSLNRILKLTNVLDKLYDELVDRIDMDLTTTDTASIMYTADYISKALQDTNKLIIDLISNDKIQNFFIIDNSQNINVSSDVDANSRERIRKAASIILNNFDLIEEGRFSELKNPNSSVEVVSKEVVEKEGNNNETTT